MGGGRKKHRPPAKHANGQASKKKAAEEEREVKPQERAAGDRNMDEGVKVECFPIIGRSATAAREFKQGECVLRDFPLLLFPKYRLDHPLFAHLDRIAENNRLQPEILYCIHHYANATTEQRRKLHEMHTPGADEAGVQYEILTKVAQEVLRSDVAKHLPISLKAQQIVDLILILRTNLHGFGPGTQMSGLFYRGSLVTHSCRPNCICTMTTERELQYHALIPIKPGDLITFSYMGNFEMWKSTVERRHIMRLQRFFNCSCERCCSEDLSRSMRCPQCDQCQCVRRDTSGAIPFSVLRQRRVESEGEEAVKKAMMVHTDRPWICRNPDCGMTWRDKDLPISEESGLELEATRNFNASSDAHKPQPKPEEISKLMAKCHKVLGTDHWATTMLVYCCLIRHARSRGTTSLFGSGEQALGWANWLMSWFSYAMPRTGLHAIIGRVCAQVAEAYKQDALAVRWYCLILPLLRVQSIPSGELQKICDFVEEYHRQISPAPAAPPIAPAPGTKGEHKKLIDVLAQKKKEGLAAALEGAEPYIDPQTGKEVYRVRVRYTGTEDGTADPSNVEILGVEGESAGAKGGEEEPPSSPAKAPSEGSPETTPDSPGPPGPVPVPALHGE